MPLYSDSQKLPDITPLLRHLLCINSSIILEDHNTTPQHTSFLPSLTSKSNTEMAGRVTLTNLEDDANLYIEKNPPHGWKHGHSNKMDWSRVECKIVAQPEYQLSMDASSTGTVTSRSRKMKNKSDKELQFELSEKVVPSTMGQVCVKGGVQPGAVPMQLQLPPELSGSGLPTTIALKGGDESGMEKVKWKVTIPKKSAVVVKVSGSELRNTGTFSQKTRLVGFVRVKHYPKRGSSYGFTEIPIDELVRATHTTDASLRDIEVISGGIEYTLRGTCTFVTSDSTIEVE